MTLSARLLAFKAKPTQIPTSVKSVDTCYMGVFEDGDAKNQHLNSIKTLGGTIHTNSELLIGRIHDIKKTLCF